MQTYLIDKRRLRPEDPGFAEALAAAHAGHHKQRPLCLCKVPGLEMYVAKFGSEYVIKRMPYTGADHAPECLSFEPSADLCGTSRAGDAAISEDPDTGLTTVRLGFALSRYERRSSGQIASSLADSVANEQAKLSLGGFLWYLWRQAELTRWIPEFEGRRNWAAVRRLLLAAASRSLARGESLRTQLFVPEPFALEHREEIAARRSTMFRRAIARGVEQQRLLLLCAELKEISPSRHGYTAIIKHVPDQLFTLDERLYLRLEKRFQAELSFWDADPEMRMMVMATFGVSGFGVPKIEELSLMTVNTQWIPACDSYEKRLVDRLVRERRRFIKTLAPPQSNRHDRVRAVLTDVGTEPATLRMSLDAPPKPGQHTPMTENAGWVWHFDFEATPALPPSTSCSSRTAAAQYVQ